MIIKTKFKDLFIFKNKSFKDKRGHFKELIKEKQIKKKLLFTVMSYSKKNVIRGLHIQTKRSQGKFISVLKGKVYDAALDLRKNSKTFGKVFTCILSEKNSKSICDALLAPRPGYLTFPINQKNIFKGLSVSDLEVKKTIFDFSRHRRIEHYNAITAQVGVILPEG